MSKTEVTISPKANKELKKVPKEIKESLGVWVDSVEKDGLEVTRSIRGYKDKALKGDRKGQRSIRLNKAWRAFYTESKNGEVKLVTIEEVNNHDY